MASDEDDLASLASPCSSPRHDLLELDAMAASPGASSLAHFGLLHAAPLSPRPIDADRDGDVTPPAFAWSDVERMLTPPRLVHPDQALVELCAKASDLPLRNFIRPGLVPATSLAASIQFCGDAIDSCPPDMKALSSFALDHADSGDGSRAFPDDDNGKASKYLLETRLAAVDPTRGGSWQSMAAQAQMDMNVESWRIMRQRHLEVSELIFWAKGLFSIAYCKKQAEAIRMGHKKGIFVLRTLVSDEATKRLRNFIKPKDSQPTICDAAISTEADLKRKRPGSTQVPVNDKVVYAEFELTFGYYECAARVYTMQTMVIPMGLFHWDRSTAENALQLQRDILEVPGLIP